MILPAVIKEIYPARPEVLADLFAPIIPNLKGEASEADKAAKGIEAWLFSLGITSKLSDEGFTEQDIDRLVELTQQTPSLGLLLSMAPVKADLATIRRIFSNSLKAM
jgi:alcohol dehydrogenase class IV